MPIGFIAGSLRVPVPDIGDDKPWSKWPRTGVCLTDVKNQSKARCWGHGYETGCNRCIAGDFLAALDVRRIISHRLPLSAVPNAIDWVQNERRLSLKICISRADKSLVNT
jgi:hypothetical protein